MTGGSPGAGGAGSTGPTLSLVTDASPNAFEAVTVTVKDCPTSAADRVSVLPT
jgi:hypothetical protein